MKLYFPTRRLLRVGAAMGLAVSPGLVTARNMEEAVGLSTHWHFECFRNGELLWEDGFDNLVVTAGLNDILDKYFKGSTYTATWFVGLKNTGTPVAGDTMGSHGSWSENTTYSQGTRPALTLGTPASGSVDNSASKAVFSITGSTTIFGGFLVTNSTKGGTTGTLYGVGDFAASRAVENGDTLNVQATLTAAAV